MNQRDLKWDCHSEESVEEHETGGQGFYHSKEPRIEMNVRAYMKRYEVLTCNAATLENSHLSGVLQIFRFAAVGSITPTWTFKGHGDILKMDGIEEKVHDVLKPLEGHLRPDPRDQCRFFDGDRTATIAQPFRILRYQKNSVRIVRKI